MLFSKINNADFLKIKNNTNKNKINSEVNKIQIYYKKKEC